MIKTGRFTFHKRQRKAASQNLRWEVGRVIFLLCHIPPSEIWESWSNSLLWFKGVVFLPPVPAMRSWSLSSVISAAHLTLQCSSVNAQETVSALAPCSGNAQLTPSAVLWRLVHYGPGLEQTGVCSSPADWKQGWYPPCGLLRAVICFEMLWGRRGSVYIDA